MAWRNLINKGGGKGWGRYQGGWPKEGGSKELNRQKSFWGGGGELLEFPQFEGGNAFERKKK